MEITSTMRRINGAIQAIELRHMSALTCLRDSEESCRLYFRGLIFGMPPSICDIIPGGLEEVVPINDGFVALVKEPDNLEAFLREKADTVVEQHENWKNWAQGVGAGHLSYYDAMQAVALYALSPVNGE